MFGKHPSALRKPSKELLDALSKNLRAAREAQRLSQEALAERSNLHRTYVGSVERGERNVSLSTLETIAFALGVEPADLLRKGGGHGRA